MERGQRRPTKNRREEPDLGEWWVVVMNMGMPTLYIAGIISGIIGCICQGVISHYWANLDNPSCFLYARTASKVLFYKFGSSMAICNWVTYGSLVAILICFFTGLLYILQVRGRKQLDVYMTIVFVGIIVSSLFMLAITCTLAEGMRITCASMGLNSANNKSSNCYDKLDVRVSQYNLPIKTSTMVRAALVSFSIATAIFFTIAFFHMSDAYNRYRKGLFEKNYYR